MAVVAVAPMHCLRIEGPDARRFAQAQFSGDVRSLEAGHWQWNAWLDAQGRVQALMHLADLGSERLLAVLRGGDAGRMCADLGRYLLRSRVVLSASTFSGCPEAALPMGRFEEDGHDLVIGFGGRSLRLIESSSAPDLAASMRWRVADIEAGWPILPWQGPHFLPPALGLERLGAISLGKGCYPGQEIVARLHFRGTHKWRLCHLRGAGALEPGAVREAAGDPLLHVLDCVPNEGRMESLAVVPAFIVNSINILGNIYHVISMFDA
jgi:folate-binding protein YgfZ